MNREKTEESKERIVVIDQGLDIADEVDPRSICCRAGLFPFRG